ncbi:hypothetical protein [Bradyrhizobium diazoefficiens]|uniref:hypothetical protein n=1 Tax=Bradyrhizobium diazoefficiens TaxID=1355477 RepID=UPI00272A715E|nr:hypothetical protein [Bradyrhizobium diazoefficiens]WLA57217.1 hypothetical protein QIH81_00295 [Bradyrhizobium diazoefficiens]
MNMFIATSVLTAAPAVPCVADEADPIFAAIEDHKRANAEYAEATREVFEDTLSPDPVKEEHFGDLERSACWDLSNTVPTTLAGLLAVLTYVDDVAEGKHSSSGRPDNAFGEEELRNVIISTQDCLRAHL